MRRRLKRDSNYTGLTIKIREQAIDFMTRGDSACLRATTYSCSYAAATQGTIVACRRSGGHVTGGTRATLLRPIGWPIVRDAVCAGGRKHMSQLAGRGRIAGSQFVGSIIGALAGAWGLAIAASGCGGQRDGDRAVQVKTGDLTRSEVAIGQRLGLLPTPRSTLPAVQLFDAMAGDTDTAALAINNAGQLSGVSLSANGNLPLGNWYVANHPIIASDSGVQ